MSRRITSPSPVRTHTVGERPDVFIGMSRRLMPLLALGLVQPALQAQPLHFEPVVVTATRASQPAAQVPFSLTSLDGTTLRTAPTATLDGALRAVPGFSLFRRSDSFSANPTAQGVSLRGLGPSGASRALVLLDGVPLNDPFGGWVVWSKVPRESLVSAEVVRGGGATAWGNAALGGVVQLFTEPAAHALSRLAITAGDLATRGAELAISRPLGSGTLQLSGRAFATAGFSLVAPERRGAIDVPAASRHHWLGARWSQPAGPGAELVLTVRTFAENRSNGTPYQRNNSRENFGAVALNVQSTPSFAWTALAYAQDQTFASTFSAVNPARTAETPASDQFAVPATVLGAAWTGTWIRPGGAHTTAGADLRHVHGETREHFAFANGIYTRLRVAGGTQGIGGLFGLHEQPLTADLRATLGGRIDLWRESAGHRREGAIATGVASRDDRYTGSSGVEFSPCAGFVWQATPELRVRAALSQAFRRPTLNELYRPFRVGSVVTEANATLRTESVTSSEIGINYTRPDLTLGAAIFWSEFHDAVGNVTLARGPGTFPLFGTLAAGGIGRQRLNLDLIRVSGVELAAEWRPTAALTISACYLYDDAMVVHAAVASALEGRRLAQVPRQSATLGATWRAPSGLTFTPRLRFLSRQFEDDENFLTLGAVFIADLNLSYQLTPRISIFLSVENLGGSRIETGRSTDGVVNTGMPRIAFGGIRTAW